MRSHIPNGAIKPAPSTDPVNDPGLASSQSRMMVAGGTIAIGDIVYESGVGSGDFAGYTAVSRASSAAIATVKPPLYVALTAAVSGQQVEVHPGPITVQMDTSAGAQGDYVYASTAGGKSLSAGTVTQIIGKVAYAGTVANGGRFTFNGAMASVASSTSTSSIPDGTAALPGLPYTSDSDTGVYKGPTVNTFSLAFGGAAGLSMGPPTPTFAAATDTAGQNVIIRSADAGASATAARAGGNLGILTGAGSAGSGTIAGGTGGSRTDVAGDGGAKSGTGAAAGGAGGPCVRTAGSGGATASTSTGAGGAGGAITDTAGAGGSATGAGSSGNGGAGGTFSRLGGVGGSSIGGTGGAGTSLVDTAGAGGASSTGAGGAGGGYTGTTGAGGAATAGTGNGGQGGDWNVVLGAGGASAGGMAGRQGQVMVQGVPLHIDHDMRYIATSVDQTITVVNRACRVMAIRGVPDVAGTDGGAVTATIRKVPSGTAITAGNALHSGTYNLKGTVDTVQNLTLSSMVADLILAAGDRIAVDYTGTLTSAVGCITVSVTPQ